jgi:hypothetical protein
MNETLTELCGKNWAAVEAATRALNNKLRYDEADAPLLALLAAEPARAKVWEHRLALTEERGDLFGAAALAEELRARFPHRSEGYVAPMTNSTGARRRRGWHG